MRKFKLKSDQIEFLKKIQRVLKSEKNGNFEIDVDTEIDFMEYIEDESVYWMDANYEASPKTYMLESIRDDIFYQTN